jgi:hypothetical protein
MKLDSPLPSFDGVAEWLTEATSAHVAKGRPLLIHFWSMSSEISAANLPQLAELRDRRKREDCASSPFTCRCAKMSARPKKFAKPLPNSI